MINKQKICILRLWNRLCAMDNSRICKTIFNADHVMGAKPNAKNWCGKVKNILETITGDNSHYANKIEVNIRDSGELLDTFYSEQWKIDVTKKEKLRTFVLFKKDYEAENYATKCISKASRAILSQFRLGIAPLKIEIGRFYRIPPWLRLCELCPRVVVEDEIHFLTECDKYNSERAILFFFAITKINGFLDLDRVEKFKIIMSSESLVHNLINYLHSAFTIRRNATLGTSWRP